MAKEAGVGPGTLYRPFPTREVLLAAVPQTRSAELVARRADIAELDDASERLRQRLRAAQQAGHARPSVKGYDLYLSAVWLAWTKSTGAHDEEALDRRRTLIEHGYCEQGGPE